jgi:hypothetical protein
MASTGKHKKSFSFRAMLSPRPQESTLPHALFDKRDLRSELSATATLNGAATATALSASGRPQTPPPRPLSYAPPAISVAAVIAGKELDASQRSQSRLSPPASPTAGARPLSYVPPAVTVAQAAQAIAEKAAQALAEKELDASQRAHTRAAAIAAVTPATTASAEVATPAVARSPPVAPVAAATVAAAVALAAPQAAVTPAAAVAVPAAIAAPAAVAPPPAVAPPQAVAQQAAQTARQVPQPVAQAEADRRTDVQQQQQQQRQQQQPAASSQAAAAAAPAPPQGSPRNLSTASLRNSFSAAQSASRAVATESGASPRSNASSPRHKSVPALLPFSPKHSAYNLCSDPERYSSLRSPRSSTGGIGLHSGGIGTLGSSGFAGTATGNHTAAAAASSGNCGGFLTGALGTVLDDDNGCFSADRRVTCSDDGSGESTVQGWSRGDIKARMRRPRMSLKRLRQHTAWLNSLGVWPRELGESYLKYMLKCVVSIIDAVDSAM